MLKQNPDICGTGYLCLWHLRLDFPRTFVLTVSAELLGNLNLLAGLPGFSLLSTGKGSVLAGNMGNKNLVYRRIMVDKGLHFTVL